MRILNLDGNYFVNAFRNLGHEVLWIGPHPACDIQLGKTLSLSDLLHILESRSFQPDLVVWNDICRPPSVVGIETLPAVTVGYSIDQYCNPWHTPYSAAFDLMLVAQKDYLHTFEEANLGNALEWQPLFCHSHKDIDQGQERDIPVGFVGTLEGSINKRRKEFYDTFKRHHPIFVTKGNYVPVYNRCRIVLNQSAVGELNFRIFEAMACGAAVLTEDTTNGLSDLFTSGEDILLYPRGNAQAAALLARKALANPDGLRELATRGRRQVIANHSSTIRAKHILKRAEAIAAQEARWRTHNPRIVEKTVGCAFTMLAVDTELGLTARQRDFYAMVGQKMMADAQR